MNEKISKYFEILYNSIHFPIQVIDEKGEVVYLNQAFALQWKTDISELKGYSVFKDINLKRSGIVASIKEIFSKKNQKFIDNYSDKILKEKDITVPILRTKMFYVSLESEGYIVMFHEDKTEYVLAQKEVGTANDNSKELERLKDTFLSVLSHELRTPLNVILGYASLIKESLYDKIEPDDKVYLDNLQSGSERLFRSLSQMLDFAQLESGSYKINIETIDLITTLKSNITTVTESAKEKNLDIKTNLTDTPIYVDVDIQCLQNVMENLLENAIKFTKKGFIEVETIILAEKDLVLVKVKDSGIGISTNYIEQLFKPFSQEELDIGRTYEGNGLGLALTKKYVEKMGGSLLVDSIKGVGSTFTFTLPLSSKKVEQEKTQKEIENVIDKKPKIFMVDDSGESPELLNAFLKKKYEINSFSFRDFKLDDLKNDEYKIIIFDVNPHRWEQGLLICKDIKKNDPLKRPIVILSSEFVETKYQSFLDAGADRFLTKPFTKEKFLDSLSELVN